MSTPVLISADELRGADVVLLDVRWALGDRNGRRHYLAGHIPGAVFVDLETELAAPASPEAGRHPLPSLSDLRSAARRWGVNNGDSVVVYDATGGMAAARAWWLLRWGGVSDVRILDGGLAAWREAGGELHRGPEARQPGNVELAGSAMPTIDAATAASWPSCGVLLDARAGARYRGEEEPIDPRAGHIPGAVSAPTSENLDETGRFASVETLKERFGAIESGVPVAVYCGSGVTAAHEIAALAIVGIEASLYPGSWSQWSNDASRPVEVEQIEQF